jgi:phosphoribosylformimino-5-aminoimidazole carboxamide ribotide isomerase
MIIIPAVDLLQGKAVRLLQGDPTRQTVFSDDPVQVALHWFAQGAERLHVVDLDGSFEGGPRNRELVEAIARAVPIPVQLGGGFGIWTPPASTCHRAWPA